MNDKFKITVIRFVDFEMVGDKSHKSISSGIATHSFHEIESKVFTSIDSMKDYLKNTYGDFYDNDGNGYYFPDIHGKDNAHIQVIIEKLKIEKIDIEGRILE